MSINLVWYTVFPTILLLTQTLSIDVTKFSDIKFRFIYGPTPSDHTVIPQENCTDLLNHVKFNISRKTVFYSFGWTEVFTGNSTQTVSKAHLKRGDHNFAVIDWSAYSKGKYSSVAPRLNGVSTVVGIALIKLLDGGLNGEMVHLVGHSLGGQLSGLAGNYVKKYSSYVIGRVTGLDPAGPGFSRQLSEKSARFVDVIHTDSFLGIYKSVGTADFYPNGGSYQSGCPRLTAKLINEYLKNPEKRCSHRKAWKFWSESVLIQHTFESVNCKSWANFKSEKCYFNDTAFMGYDVSPNASGNYYLQTNPNGTYGRHINGVIYDPKIL